MSKPGVLLKKLCKRLGIRLTVKRNGKRVYKSVKVLKTQCAKRKKKVKRKRKKVKRKRRKVKRKRKKVKRRRRFGTGGLGARNTLPSGYYKAKYDYKTGKQNCTPCTKNPKALYDDCRFNSIYDCERFVTTPHSVEDPQKLYNKVMDIGGIRRGMLGGYMGQMNKNTVIAELEKLLMQINKSAIRIQQLLSKVNVSDHPIVKSIARAGAFLKKANLRGANLQGANLIGANLLEANLEGANLQRTNLRGAYLAVSDLRGADLRGADLIGANLLGADLRETNFKGAELIKAFLGDADLRGADLREAYLAVSDLRGADLRGADLRGADLRGARYDNDTKFPERFNPLGFNMVRVNIFGKKRKKRK